MFTLLNPAALLALLGLLVPVAIHLWNRRPGREVAVGSLRWLAAGANRRLRNLKPEQFWLLLLRAALLAVLALAVAEPVWRQPQPASRGVVLLSPEALTTPAFATLRPTIDSLRRRGYVVRWLAAGFARVPAAAWRADSMGQAAPLAATQTLGNWSADFHWLRVQQAAGLFPGQPLFVVTSAVLRNFHGTHPPLPATVTWQTLPITAAKTWLQAAAMRTDSLRLLLGRSTETQTVFRLVSVARPQAGAVVRVAGMPPLRFESGADSSYLKPLRVPGDSADTAERITLVRTRPLHITIYATAGYSSDAHYWQASLRAAAIGLPVPLVLTTTNQIPNPNAPPDWLFWLSDTPLPTGWQSDVSRGTTIWQEAHDPGTADTTNLANDAEAAPITVFRRGSTKALPTAQPLWTDGHGRPILTRRTQGRGAFYQLHTRLNPAWSELANDANLPARLLALLQPEPTDGPLLPELAIGQARDIHDQRALDPTQVLTTNVVQHQLSPTQRPAAPSAFRFTDLRPWLVLAAGLLFLFERMLAHRRDTQALFTTVS